MSEFSFPAPDNTEAIRQDSFDAHFEVAMSALEPTSAMSPNGHETNLTPAQFAAHLQLGLPIPSEHQGDEA